MATAVLKRVAIDNYKIFNTKQVVDFTVDTVSPKNGEYFTLVGENGSGKSTFLALVGLASDFGGRVSKRVCDSSRESIVACEYVVENWTELSYHENNSLVNIYPALELWFLAGILKIPKELHQFFAEKHPGLTTSPLTVVIGFKHTPSSYGQDEPIVSKFVYVKSSGQVTALVQPFNESAMVVTVNSSEAEDLIQWKPNHSSLVSTHCNFLRFSTPVFDRVDLVEGLKPKHPQAALILALRKLHLPVQSRDTIWDDVISLFHQLTGDTKITVIYDPESGSIRMRQRFGGCESIRDDLPEGFFHAFIVAFLVISPLVKTVLLDDPTRGMHPLQIRRLQQILSQKSIEKDKVIVVATHAPDMVHTSRINRIFRFQRLNSGYTEIRRVSWEHGYRELRFISSLESRELFFTRRIIWVEGDTDRRFCDTILKMIDEGNEVLWSVLLDPRDRKDATGHPRALGGAMSVEDMDEDESSSSLDEIDYGATGINPLYNLFSSPAYEKRYFRAKELQECQELARNCSILSLSGKKNIDKATRICKDLGIPYAVICDLDAVLPNSKRNSIKSQFMKCAGNWSLARVDKKLLFDGEQSPASVCVDDPALRAQLKQCRHASDVIEFYESEERIFAWRVGNGEIEDLVRVTKTNFAKKWWADFTFDAFQSLIENMLVPNSLSGGDFDNQSNPELLRCFYFIFRFLQDVV